MPLQKHIYRILRWSEKYTKTDMVYLFTSGVWGNLGAFSVSLFSFILYIAFAHFLSKESYGTYQYLLSISAIVGGFTLMGMNTAVAQAVARGYEGSLREAVRVQLRWNIIPLLGAWAFALYYTLHGNSTLGIGLFLIGIGTPFVNTFNTYGALLAGKSAFKRGFFYNLFGNIPYYGALILVAFFFNAPIPLLIANLFAQAVALFVLYRITLAVYKPNNKVDSETVAYGKHLSLMSLFGTVTGQMDSVLAFHFLGPANLAIYSFATAIPERLSSFFKFIPAAALPKFAVKTDEEIKRSILAKTGIGLVAGTIIAIVYIALAKLFFILFFPTYMAAVPYSQLYGLVIITSIGAVFPTALMAKRRIKSLYIFNIAIPLIQLVLQFVGVLSFGLWGLIVAKILFWIIYGILALILLLLEKSEESVVLQ